ncbi:hypothetical protein RR42_s2973 [Cupriavidus basilensis]|uniref:Uncharacterized protein n=1 Tax=Cupriavidus basilensis TaxID=68895 RepID=A0A0C4YRD8_9BURK|nr:hypothetical protein RR42_s2973 [Cupriavidus basilensis]
MKASAFSAAFCFAAGGAWPGHLVWHRTQSAVKAALPVADQMH